MAKKAPLLERLFRRKKIVIVSENKITTVPFSPILQAGVTGFAVLSLLWGAYTSGKYFAYQDVLSQKEREILNTSLTNETLQYKISDLSENLLLLNNYFDQVKKYDHMKKSLSKVDKEKAKPKVSKDMAKISDNVQNVLLDINSKIKQRINSIEKIISRTGISVDDIGKKDKSVKKVSKSRKEFLKQGGPFIAANTDLTSFDMPEFEKHLNQNVQYLLVLEKILGSYPLSSPMDASYISSRFGKRIDPVRGTPAMHYGIDFVGKYRENVVATAPGKVIKAGRNGAYGMFVEIKHDFGITTRYGHMSKVLVKKGQTVNIGQSIGKQGNTGRSTGAHLHYEIRYNGKPVNPQKFLKAGAYVFKA